MLLAPVQAASRVMVVRSSANPSAVTTLPPKLAPAPHISPVFPFLHASHFLTSPSCKDFNQHHRTTSRDQNVGQNQTRAGSWRNITRTCLNTRSNSSTSLVGLLVRRQQSPISSPLTSPSLCSPRTPIGREPHILPPHVARQTTRPSRPWFHSSPVSTYLRPRPHS